MKRPVWLERWLARNSATPAAEPNASTSLPGGADPLADIHTVTATDAESSRRALAALERAVGTELERSALSACLTAHARKAAPSSLSIAAAKLLFQRGEPAEAVSLLEGLPEPEAWSMLAEFYAESGQGALAKPWLERVVARDIDASGALDKLRELSRQERERPLVDQITLLSEHAPSTTLSIAREIGRGGAATVYEAFDGVLQRSVALKLYHHPQQMRQHLLREARMAVRLAGPHVIRLFDADPERGWIAMELASRGTLKERLTSDEGGASPMLAWLFPLVETLARIHDSGHVHADLKPANVLFRADGSVVLSDFGLAVPIGAEHHGASPGYVSPERAAGASAAPSDDVYALGCLLEQVLEREPAQQQIWAPVAQQLLSPDRPVAARQVLALLPAKG